MSSPLSESSISRPRRLCPVRIAMTNMLAPMFQLLSMDGMSVFSLSAQVDDMEEEEEEERDVAIVDRRRRRRSGRSRRMTASSLAGVGDPSLSLTSSSAVSSSSGWAWIWTWWRRGGNHKASMNTSSLLIWSFFGALHAFIVGVLGFSVYAMITSTNFSMEDRTICTACTGYLFTMTMGFAAYFALAIWLWFDREASRREDPEEYELKQAWLIRSLVALLAIAFIWGLLVSEETPCFQRQPIIQDSVIAFLVLGSSVLALAIAFHGVCVILWAVNSITKVITGGCEALALSLSLILGLAPYQELFSSQRSSLTRRPLSSSYLSRQQQLEEDEGLPFSFPSLTSRPSFNLPQVAEELPLPFYKVSLVKPSSASDHHDDGVARGVLVVNQSFDGGELAADLPTALPVSWTCHEDANGDEIDDEGEEDDNDDYHVGRRALSHVMGSSLDSLFDVTPLSGVPPFPSLSHEPTPPPPPIDHHPSSDIRNLSCCYPLPPVPPPVVQTRVFPSSAAAAIDETEATDVFDSLV